MLVTSIFSFSYNVFFPTKDTNHLLTYLYFIDCKCFQFGSVQNLIVQISSNCCYLQGVHTSPKGIVSSSGFVFGENLAERVEIKTGTDVDEKSIDNGVASPDSTEQSEQISGTVLDRNDTFESFALASCRENGKILLTPSSICAVIMRNL